MSLIIIDSTLREENLAIERELLLHSETFYKNSDFRWFFTEAHGRITQKINTNLDLFIDPNAILNFNRHFARAYLRALQGLPSREWQLAFQACQALENYDRATSWMGRDLPGEIEACGLVMAKVHIQIDICNALRDTGCPSVRDFGNTLALVEAAGKLAMQKLRGPLFGHLEFEVQRHLLPNIVKIWRNAAYESICHTPVKDPEHEFLKRFQGR